MSQDEYKRIGLIVGREWDWPEAFIQTINNIGEGITAELVKVGGTYMNETCPYAVIIDRKSHIIPYYRIYLKFAALQGCTIINNPFTWAADDKFLGTFIINRLGLNSPRTVVLPNKQVKRETVTASFRNLKYPMDWQSIIEYVGVPAIFKDVYSVGRGKVYRVHNVDELIQRYDESGTYTMVLQEIIESDTHIHCFVVGQEHVLVLQYSLINGRYLPTAISPTDPIGQQAAQNALSLTRTYGYDVNMVEFVVKNNQLYVINSTNPAPVMDKQLMTAEQFTWCVDKIAALAIDRVKRPISQKTILPESW